MTTLLLGFFLLVGVVVSSLEGSSEVYLQYRSFAVVVVGTVAVLFFSTSAPVLKTLAELVGKLFKPEESVDAYQDDLKVLSQKKTASIDEKSHPIVHYASELWSQGVDPDLFIVLLSQKRNDLISRGIDAVISFKNLAKYPPALGMTGTVMGIINVFNSLEKNKDSIGSNLAVAMTATFMGLILANLLISPLADRLSVRQMRQERLIEGLYEILLLINRGEPAVLIQGEMNDRAA